MKTVAVLAAIAFGMAAHAATASRALAESEVYQSGASLFGAKLAVSGYDAVAYHKAGKPAPGKAEFSHDWKGATWRFASAENLEAFKAAPETYAPQYGGYCAYAVSKGYTAHGDPLAWAIVDRKLYLNYNASVQKTWDKDQSGYIKSADGHWPDVLNR